MLKTLSRLAAAALVAAGPAFAQTPPASLPPVAAPSEPSPPVPCDKCAAEDKKPEEKNPFANMPPIQPFPRPGYFGVAPTGPGYYSLLDELRDDYREKPPKYPYP